MTTLQQKRVAEVLTGGTGGQKSADGGRSVSAGLRGLSYDQGRAALDPGAPALQYKKTESGSAGLDTLTASQRTYIETLRAIEKANSKATPDDIAMCISLLLWEGRIWDRDGSAADVTNVAGVPLVADYAGDKGYEDVKLSPEQKKFLRSQRGVKDQQGNKSGVAHTFPAVAAQSGREGTVTGGLNTRMVTEVGDFIQDMGRVIVEQKLDGVFRDAEKRDNDRAIAIAAEIGDCGQPLSDALLDHFLSENENK